MAFRFHVVTDCLGGCAISILLSILLALKFDSAVVGLMPMLIIPPLGCWLGGVRRRDSLLMIAVFGLVGWFVGAYAFNALVGPQSQGDGMAELPLSGFYSILSCAIGSGGFALVASFFIRPEKLTTFGKTNANSTEN